MHDWNVLKQLLSESFNTLASEFLVLLTDQYWALAVKGMDCGICHSHIFMTHKMEW